MVEQGANRLQRDQLTQLAATLRDLEAGYGSLLGMLRIRKEQVRRGEIKMLHVQMEGERDCLKRIAALDEMRGRLVGKLVGAESGTGSALSIDAVMPLATGRLATELRAGRSALRATLEAVQSEYAVLQLVGESLFAHVSSLIQRLGIFGVGAAVYGRDGRFDGGQPMVSGVDFRT